MPFITENLWKVLFSRDSFLMNEVVVDVKTQDNFITSQNNFKYLTQIISSIRNLRSELDIPYKEKIILNINNEDKDFCSFIRSTENQIIRLLKLSELNLNDLSIKSEGSANIVVANSTLMIPLSGVIDTTAEIKKLTDKKNKKLIELQKIQDKLENKKFILKAPEQIVTQFKNQEQEIKYSIEKIEQIIDTIN